MFPFWIVVQRVQFVAHPVESMTAPDCIVGFSTAEHAATFMTGRGETEWENKLVCRADLRSLRLIGVAGVCLDPAQDGIGRIVLFDDLEAV